MNAGAGRRVRKSYAEIAEIAEKQPEFFVFLLRFLRNLCGFCVLGFNPLLNPNFT